MTAIHCFEVVGEVLFRPSGNAGHPPTPCVVLTTRAIRKVGTLVEFIELDMSQNTYEFPGWFADWDDERDNWRSSRRSFQLGRCVEVAVPRPVYDAILRGRHLGERGFHLIGSQLHWTGASSSVSDVIQGPIAAVKIDGEWVFPHSA